MKLRHLTRSFALALLSAAAFTRPASGQDCIVIERIFINNQSVFDTSEMEDGSRLLGLYNFANSLHWQTREDFLASELLFERGDCLDPELLAESERLLRNLDFIAYARVFPIEMEPGVVHVVVDTKDEWTLQFSLGMRFEEGLEFSGASVVQENFLGRGIGVNAFVRQRRESKEAGLRLTTERLLGTRTNGRLSVGKTRIGEFLGWSLVYPFVGEVGRFAARASFSKDEDLFSFALEDDLEFTNVVVPLEDERFELSMAGRFGTSGSLTVFGGGISIEEIDFTGIGSGIEAVIDKDFANRFEAPEEYQDIASAQMNEQKVGRLNFVFGQRYIRFAPRMGLDALRGVVDVATGVDLSVMAGQSIGFLTSSDDSTLRDMFGRARIFVGLAPGAFVFNSTLSIEGRQVFQSDRNPEGWRDVFAEADFLAYWKPHPESAHTLVGRFAAAAGWHVDIPYQVTLGGVQGVRGYSLSRHPGAHRVIFNLEDRIYFGSPWGQALDLGMTLFGDLGRAWAGDSPFGRDTGWLGSVGAGLRLGFPSGTRGVTRIDVATPTNGPDAFKALTFRVSSTELLGLRFGFEDNQVRRSRRSQIGVGILPNPVTGR